VWPGLPDYRLPTVASHLGYEFVHHHAGDDAAACGYVAHRQLADANIKTLEELAAQIGLHIGEIGIGSYSPCTKVRSIVTERISQIVSAGSVSGPSHPLFGKSLVFTGELRSFTRHDAATRAIACGAICQDNPTKTTSLLVVGASPGAGKLQKARTLQSKGSAIRVISEADFISLLG